MCGLGRLPKLSLAAITLMGITAVAYAQGEAETAAPGSKAWMMTSSALVLLMTPGLAFFYGGLVRRKNVLSVLMQCYMCIIKVRQLPSGYCYEPLYLTHR